MIKVTFFYETWSMHVAGVGLVQVQVRPPFGIIDSITTWYLTRASDCRARLGESSGRLQRQCPIKCGPHWHMQIRLGR